MNKDESQATADMTAAETQQTGTQPRPQPPERQPGVYEEIPPAGARRDPEPTSADTTAFFASAPRRSIWDID